MIADICIEFLQLIEFFTNLPEEVGYRLILAASKPGKKGVTRLNIQLYGGDTRTVLTAVVLFFHQQVHLIESPHYGTVLLLVIGKRLSEPDKSQSALVFDSVAHEEATKLEETML